MLHDLTWFTDRVGGYIKRGSTDVFIDSEETAKKLHALQSPSYTFDAKVVIHSRALAEIAKCGTIRVDGWF